MSPGLVSLDSNLGVLVGVLALGAFASLGAWAWRQRARARQAEREVERIRRSSEAPLASPGFAELIVNAVSDPIFVKDREHRLVYVNDAECRLSGHAREELVGKTDYDFFPREQVDVFWRSDDRVFATGTEDVTEECITGADGRLRTIITKKTLHTASDGHQVLVGIIRDITERKSAEEEVRRLNGELEQRVARKTAELRSSHLVLEEAFHRLTLDAAARRQAQEEVRRLSAQLAGLQEDERRRLALALHDGAVQSLVAASVWVDELAVGAPPARLGRFESLRKLLESIFEELRSLSHDLRPAVLDDLGLVVALRELTEQYSTASCTVALSVPQDRVLELPANIGIGLYRIVQSALGNVIRHSGARLAEVSLQVDGNEVCLEITDNGSGFDARAHDKRSGLGLIGMRERASWLDGNFVLESSPGHGTRIEVRVPLSTPAAKPVEV